jgi:hypothetical protein
MIVANIPSLRPYYVDLVGRIFNHKYKMIVAKNSKNVDVLAFRDLENVERKISFARLSFITWLPSQCVKNCTVVRCKLNVEYPYRVQNLEAVPNKLMPTLNNLSIHKSNLVKPKHFFSDFDATEIKVLFDILQSSRTNNAIAKMYNVSNMAIYRAKKHLRINKYEAI